MTEPARDLVGETISHFRVLARIGEGGMGIVYRAEDLLLGRVVALKVLRADFVVTDERRQRFLREARTAAALNHPNVATDGAHLAVTGIGDRAPVYRLLLSDLEGHAEVVATTETTWLSGPRFSPSGRKLAITERTFEARLWMLEER